MATVRSVAAAADACCLLEYCWTGACEPAGGGAEQRSSGPGKERNIELLNEASFFDAVFTVDRAMVAM